MYAQQQKWWRAEEQFQIREERKRLGTGTATTGTVGTRALLARKEREKRLVVRARFQSLSDGALAGLGPRGLGLGCWTSRELVRGGQGLRRPFSSLLGVSSSSERLGCYLAPPPPSFSPPPKIKPSPVLLFPSFSSSPPSPPSRRSIRPLSFPVPREKRLPRGLPVLSPRYAVRIGPPTTTSPATPPPRQLALLSLGSVMLALQHRYALYVCFAAPLQRRTSTPRWENSS